MNINIRFKQWVYITFISDGARDFVKKVPGEIFDDLFNIIK